MIKEALQYLIGLSKPVTLQVDGRDYATTAIHSVDPPGPQPLGFSTLNGLGEYIMSGGDGGCTWDGKSGKVVIASPTDVRFCSHLIGPWFGRNLFAMAAPPADFEHPWNKYLNQEQFIIWLQSDFVRTDDRDALLRLVGNLRSEQIATLADDGVTQVASVKAGLSRVNEIEVKNPIMLRPFRTFAEIEQPESRFIVRLRDAKDNQPPSIALFDVADYTWKLTAMLGIKNYLSQILRETNIPIFA